jgi:hypothetical protein
MALMARLSFCSIDMAYSYSVDEIQLPGRAWWSQSD